MIKQMSGSIKMIVAALSFSLAHSVAAGSFANDTKPVTRNPERLYFPTAETWETIEPASVGWKPDALDEALNFAMSCRSSGIVVLHRGRILAERHQPVEKPSLRYRGMVHGQDDEGRVIEDVASVQKSVASILVGMAQEKGLLHISDPVHKHLGAGWSNASTEKESHITIRHLISMSSGLTDRLRYSVPPGTKWKYNTNAYCLSVRAVAAAAKMTPNEVTKAWLTGPLGMNDSRWVERRLAKISPPETNRLGFATTARDLARFGLLVLAEGQWNRSAVLADQAYFKDALTPSQEMNPGYGYLWWLNGQKLAQRPGRAVRGLLNAEAPQDLVAALGALGRKCYVVPSLELVVTRLGDQPDSLRTKKFDTEFWRLLMKAAPGQPK